MPLTPKAIQRRYELTAQEFATALQLPARERVVSVTQDDTSKKYVVVTEE